MPVYSRVRLVDILYNLHQVLGYGPGLFYECHQVFSSDDDDDSVSPFLKEKNQKNQRFLLLGSQKKSFLAKTANLTSLS